MCLPTTHYIHNTRHSRPRYQVFFVFALNTCTRGCSGQLALHVGHGWHQVDGAASDNHGGLAGKNGAAGVVDVVRGNAVDVVHELGHRDVAVGRVVAGNLLETVAGALHREQEVHLDFVLGAGELSLVNRVSEAVKSLKSHFEEILRVGASTGHLDAEEAGVGEVGVNSLNAVEEAVAGNGIESTVRSGVLEHVGVAEELSGDAQGVHVVVAPWDRLEGDLNGSLGGLGPGAVLTTNVLGLLAHVLVLGDSEDLTKALLHELNVLVVVLDAGSDDQALLGGDVVHDELLEHAGIDVADVVVGAKQGHAEGVVAVSGRQEELLIAGRGVVLVEVVGKVVRLLVLGLGHVGGKDGAGLKSNVNHHLEHVNGVVLNAVTAEVHGFLIVVHGHVTTGHLDHAVVDGLVSVLQGLKVSVLEGEERAGGLSGLVTDTNVDVES